MNCTITPLTGNIVTMCILIVCVTDSDIPPRIPCAFESLFDAHSHGAEIHTDRQPIVDSGQVLLFVQNSTDSVTVSAERSTCRVVPALRPYSAVSPLGIGFLVPALAGSANVSNITAATASNAISFLIVFLPCLSSPELGDYSKRSGNYSKSNGNYSKSRAETAEPSEIMFDASDSAIGPSSRNLSRFGELGAEPFVALLDDFRQGRGDLLLLRESSPVLCLLSVRCPAQNRCRASICSLGLVG